MAFISIYLVVFLYIFYFDLLPIAKNGYTKLYVINIFFTIISLILVILTALNFHVPSLSDFIENILKVIIS